VTALRAKKNVAVLAVCQALFTAATSILTATGGLVGYRLAADKSLATLPVTAVVVGIAVATIPASLLMGRVGRRAGFVVGALIGATGGGLASFALYVGSFPVFSLGTMLVGMFVAFGQYYRFAAADVAGQGFKGKAISLVLAGGVVAGFVGPELAKWSKDLVGDTRFLGTYVVVVALGLVSAVLVMAVDIPRPPASVRRARGRPIWRIMCRPTFVVAALNGMVGYGVMSLVMTATPLAMVASRYPFDDAATVIQWHVVAMFAPAFVTGSLIDRFGVLKVMLSGAAAITGGLGFALSGQGLGHYWAALVLLGLGWNFMFIGGTTLLTETYEPAERAKTQAANDFLVFAAVASASLSSGQILYRFGWEAVNLGALPFLALAIGATLWLALQRRAAGQAV